MFVVSFFSHSNKTYNGEPDPNGKGIERSHISIVPFAGLIARLVQVNDNSKAGKKEKKECNDPIFSIAHKLVHATDNAKNEGQEVELVMSLIIL